MKVVKNIYNMLKNQNENLNNDTDNTNEVSG